MGSSKEVNLREVLPPEVLRAKVTCADWREAVRASGDLLVANGAAEASYVDAIVRAVEEHGPYIVLAPGIALAHARPEEGAIAVGFSLVTLAEPVRFGAVDNDPVDVVFGFATPDAEKHIDALSALAGYLESGDNLRRLRAAATDEELLRVIKETAT